MYALYSTGLLKVIVVWSQNMKVTYSIHGEVKDISADESNSDTCVSGVEIIDSLLT
jgi:hypothetical protein